MIVTVLDACVLVPGVLADTLLRCAEHEMYRPAWSESILDEVRRNLPASVNEAAAERRIEAMRRHFPEALVTASAALVARMTNQPKDRHVLATAVAANAEFIVTANLKDFRPTRWSRTRSRRCIPTTSCVTCSMRRPTG